MADSAEGEVSCEVVVEEISGARARSSFENIGVEGDAVMEQVAGASYPSQDSVVEIEQVAATGAAKASGRTASCAAKTSERSEELRNNFVSDLSKKSTEKQERPQHPTSTHGGAEIIREMCAPAKKGQPSSDPKQLSAVVPEWKQTLNEPHQPG
ncbi:unnamed protein product [Prorocentrum cordatum]|uniref:Uncharacterized protein n=1 Tax=Prorocentrum cordatum TaxID=2364126 RepID=A0ABN9P604_9DINO|nr:unnamed protein product [Polarella glacialis]